MKKSDKRSCCARGGAWFKNCGDADETKFDHTWLEGIQACRSKFEINDTHDMGMRGGQCITHANVSTAETEATDTLRSIGLTASSLRTITNITSLQVVTAPSGTPG